MDLIKKSDVQNYFDKIIEELNNVQIIKVCSFDDSGDDNRYFIEEPLYIIFNNKKALIIEYYFIDGLSIEYRNLTEEEIYKFSTIDIRDFFNRTEEIYDHHTKNIKRRNSLRFSYDAIDNININNVNEKDYYKWENNDLVSAKPTNETFDKITFNLRNGNKIILCPEPAEMDGYLDVWAEGVDFNQTKY